MPKKFSAPTGTADFLPDDHTFFTFVKKVIRHRFRQAGFRRISVPIFEETQLFQKSIGIESSIVDKELYSFKDPHERSFSLRPEMRTGIVRSFIEHNMHEQALPVELYYIDPCFRFERPQSRTKREFWQFGAEVIGESDPSIDAQIIYLGYQILSDLGIWDACDLKINTIGSTEDRKAYYEALKNFYTGKERSLSPRSLEKFQQEKYLELLSPQNEDEEILLKMAPKIIDYLSTESRDLFNETLNYLNSFGIKYTLDPSVIPPVEYHTHTVFEFHEKDSRRKVIAGGRYDHLVESLGGLPHGAVGFSAGVERVIRLMKAQGTQVPFKDFLQIFVSATGVVAKKHALPLLVKLRQHGFHAVGVLGKTSMTEQLERAQKHNVPYTILMGDIEIREKKVLIRDMKTGKSETINEEDVLEHMQKLLKTQPLDSTDDFLFDS